MADQKPKDSIVIADLRGGRNQSDPPMSLPANQCIEAINVDWRDTTVARKRGGAAAIGITGGTAFGSTIDFLYRFVPGSDETAAELWGIDGDGTPVKRLTGGTTWADVTVSDALPASVYEVVGATLNGKLFLAYNSTVDRLHVYDPRLASPRLRRVSFATPAAPTVANTGAGAYAATLRYYRVRWLQLSTDNTVLIRRSEPGASVSFTPSGTGSAARITQPAVPGEQETHWEVEVSTDNVTWYWRAGFDETSPTPFTAIAIATTILDDIRIEVFFSDGGTNNNQAGLYGRFPSVKYLLSDGNRLLGTGSWESGGADSDGRTARVWFTPVLGSADRGDDERVIDTTSQKNWIDLNENDGGGATGLGGPINGIPYAFKYRQIWRLRPTGDVGTPYLPRKIRDDVGCISHKSLTIGEDQSGNAALYFISHRGPYRITSAGAVEYLGRDNEDIWRSLNLGATILPHSQYHPELHQWWVWIATGANTTPEIKMVFDVQLGVPDEYGQIRGGWAEHDGPSAAARSSVLFSNTLGASMSRDLKPHIGRGTGSAIWKLDTADLDDAGTDFQAFIEPRPILTTAELGHKVGMYEPYILAVTLTGVTLTLTSRRDFGKETRTHTQTLTAEDGETRIFKKFEGGEVGEASIIQVRIGDGAAQEGAWSIDAVVIPKTRQEWK